MDVSSAATYPTTYGWQNLSPANAPPPGYGSSMTYDATDHNMLLFGGSIFKPGSYFPYAQTWTFANGSWTNLTSTAGSPSPGLYGHAPPLAYDAKDGSVFMLDPDATLNFTAWKFSAGLWTQLPAPPVTNLSSAVYDSTDGYVLATSYYTGCSATDHAVSYSYAAGIWSKLSTRAAPCFYNAYFSDDPSAGGVLVTGGHLRVSGTFVPNNQTWLFSAGTWTNLTASAPLGIRYPFYLYLEGLTYNPAGSAVVAAVPDARGVDTWAYNGTWSNVSAVHPPPARAYPSFGWDPAIKGALLFGGESTYGTNTTWAYEANLTLAAFPPLADRSDVDVGIPLKLTAEFQGGTGPWNVTWNFGDSSTGSGAITYHRYSTPRGTTTVVETIRDATGATVSAQLSVNVSDNITASAEYAPRPTEVGVPTDFIASSTGGSGAAVGYAWSYGDGTGNFSIPYPYAVHTYRSGGNFTATLWANDSVGGGFGIATVAVQVAPALNVTYNATPDPPALGQLVNFTSTVKGGVSPYIYSWAFGDGGIGGNLAKISHVFTTNGPFTAILTVRDAIGTVVTASHSFTVALNLSILGSWDLGAAPLPVAFTSRVSGGTPGYSYRWSFGDGATDSTANPTHTYALPGAYDAVLTVQDSQGRSAQASWSLFVSSGGGPLQVHLDVSPTSVPVGSPSVITATISGGSGGYLLRWSAGGVLCVVVTPVAERCSSDVGGTYGITAVVTDSAGDSQSGSGQLIVGIPGTVNHPVVTNLLFGPLGWGVLAATIAVAVGALLSWSRLRPIGKRGQVPVRPPRTPPDEDEEDSLGDLV